MGTHNSLGTEEASFYLSLFITIHNDVAGASAATSIEIERDVATLRRRFDAEGIAFLTRTLPRLGKAVDSALSNSTPLQFAGFKSLPKTQYPIFMGWLFRIVFDTNGYERCEASGTTDPRRVSVALGHLRQLLYLLYKLELPYTEEQEDKVLRDFVHTDKSTSFNLDALSVCDKNVCSLAKHLIHTVLSEGLNCSELIPRHGPGAVATGEKPHEKPYFKRWYRALDECFPYEKYFFYNANHFSDNLDGFYTWESEEAGTAKVVLVPKDSRGPRIISCEPLEYQWIQQGIMKQVVKRLSSHQLTRGRINFRDQTINRSLALRGSSTGEWVTLDMKEASDRVLTSHIEYFFPETWKKILLASRSVATKLPDGSVIRLRKFAPMGSALCFPVEALLFWAMTVAAIKNANIGGEPLETVARTVFVFGDDIIVRQKDHLPVLSALPKIGLQFNLSKCCVSGFFRESCGCDAHRGIDVTPLKIKRRWCHHLAGSDHVSWVEYHNSLADRGYFEAADYLARKILATRQTPWANNPGSACPCLIDPRKNAVHENKLQGLKTRFSPRSHCYEVYAWTARPAKYIAGAPGWEELLRVTTLCCKASDLDTPDGEFTRDEDKQNEDLGHRWLKSRLALSTKAEVDYLPTSSLVRACQYTARRSVIQTRRWARVIL
jgi:hypothetical protein